MVLPLFTALSDGMRAATADALPDSRPCVIRLDSAFADATVRIDQPAMNPNIETDLLLFALPNGNTIEWTAGKRMAEGDDWHFDIQHIAAQTRFLRAALPDRNIVTAYIMANNKSWPSTVSTHAKTDSNYVSAIVDSIVSMYAEYRPQVILNGHSGGGRFVLRYIEEQESIPDQISRIAFLDSDYAYDENTHLKKLVDWIDSDTTHALCAIAYNDSTVIFNGKPLVSPRGGTWYRTRWMQRGLSEYFDFETKEDTSMIVGKALDGRIQFRLKHNPEGKIYHTVLVERNGLIHTVLSGTDKEDCGYTFWGDRAYDTFIADTVWQ